MRAANSPSPCRGTTSSAIEGGSMSEKTWRNEGAFVWFGGAEPQVGDRCFKCESEASAIGAVTYFNALTRERDEAVRERDELRAAFREFPLVIKIVGNVTLHESVVWDGDFDSIDDAELRTVVMKFLKALPSTPLRIAFGDSLATDKSPETKDGEG